MYEKSRGRTIVDYLSGREMEETTYEEFRQELARRLVEEKGYPRQALKARVEVAFPMAGKQYVRLADLAAYDREGRPLLVLMFVSGTITSYFREVVATARLFPDGPAPLAVVTDLGEAALLRSSDGEVLEEGMDAAIPDYDQLEALAAAHPVESLEGERLARERRVLYTYNEYLLGCHSGEPLPPERDPE